MLELSVDEMWRRYPTVREHPIVRRIWPGDVGERAHRIWQERERFIEALDRLPQTVCHQDFKRGNLLCRRRAD